MFPYCKTLKILIRFLLSISTCISGDSASDFLDMKMLIGSVTYLKQYFMIRQDYLSQLGVIRATCVFHVAIYSIPGTVSYVILLAPYSG